MQYANLLAAARAALAATRDGDPYALEFLTDELVAHHGQHDLDDRRPGGRTRWSAATHRWEVPR